MKRLTSKTNSKPYSYKYSDIDDCMVGTPIEKLGQLEDILEKYEIDKLCTLDKVLEIHRWLSNHDYTTMNKDDFDVMFNELKKYKDIEEDLGIDLITLFKAQKEGIWELAFNGYDEEIKPTCKPRKVTRHLCIDFKQKTLAEMWWRYDFSDYGKKELGGWALTKEELE